MENKIKFINKVDGRFTINFKGAFPNNKFALKKDQPIYLTEEELEFIEANYPHILGVKIVREGEKPEVDTEEDNKIDGAEFFDLHHAKAKSQAKDLNKEQVEALIEYANFNEIDNSVTTALIKRANELSE